MKGGKNQQGHIVMVWFVAVVVLGISTSFLFKDQQVQASGPAGYHVAQLMTVRQFLASQALSGIVSTGPHNDRNVRGAVSASYRYADEMLRQGGQ